MESSPIPLDEQGEFDTAQQTQPPPPPPAPQASDRWSAHVSWVIGYKGLESGWAPASDQFEFGVVDLDFKPPRWPISFVIQTLMTYSNGIPDQPGFRGDFCGTYEFNFGLRKIWDRHLRLQPFIGGGFSVLGGDTVTHWEGWWYDQEDSDAAMGWWVSSGLYYNLSPAFHIGGQVVYSDGEIELFGRKLNAGGLNVVFMIGMHW